MPNGLRPVSDCRPFGHGLQHQCRDGLDSLGQPRTNIVIAPDWVRWLPPSTQVKDRHERPNQSDNQSKQERNKTRTGCGGRCSQQKYAAPVKPYTPVYQLPIHPGNLGMHSGCLLTTTAPPQSEPMIQARRVLGKTTEKEDRDNRRPPTKETQLEEGRKNKPHTSVIIIRDEKNTTGTIHLE